LDKGCPCRMGVKEKERTKRKKYATGVVGRENFIVWWADARFVSSMVKNKHILRALEKEKEMRSGDIL